MDNPPAFTYAFGKLEAAVEELKGRGNVRQKLLDATMALALVSPEDFPDHLRGEYEQILEAVSWLPSQGGSNEGKVATTINEMPIKEAKSLVKRISALYMRARDALYESEFEKLQRQTAAGGDVEIPLMNGGVARFPKSALEDAFLNTSSRLHGENIEEHPLCEAARNSSDPSWRESFFAGGTISGGIEAGDVPDLSE
jgi:hypothetical protein